MWLRARKVNKERFKDIGKGAYLRHYIPIVLQFLPSNLIPYLNYMLIFFFLTMFFCSILCSPFISLNVGGQFYDDANTPIIPIIPIEEREEMDLSSSSAPSNISVSSARESLIQGLSTSTIPIIPQCKSVAIPEPSSTGISAHAISHSSGNEVVIATVAAANILKSKGLENLIDTDLLLLFLKNPEFTQELFNKHLLSSTIDTGTSESNAFGHAFQVPSSQLPIDISDNRNSTSAKARSMIELSSTAHANSWTASGPQPVQTTVSLLTSTIDFLMKSLCHEKNQLKVAAMQISEQLLDANAGKGPKQEIPSGTYTSNACDLLTDKSTWSQSVSTEHLTVTKTRNQSADPKTGTCSQPKQVGLPVSLSFPPSDLQSRKRINEQLQLENFGARPGSALKAENPSISLSMSAGDFPSKKSTNEHNWQADTRNVRVPQSVTMQSVAADADSGYRIEREAGSPPVPLPTSTYDFLAEKPTSKQNHQVLAAPAITQSIAANTRNQKGFRVKPGVVPMSVRDSHSKESLNAVADLVAENQPISAPKINDEFWGKQSSKSIGYHTGSPPNFRSYQDANLVHETRENLEISHFKKLIDEDGAHHHGKGGREPVAGTDLMFPNPDMKLSNKRAREYGHGSPPDSAYVPSPFPMFEAFSPLREQERLHQPYVPSPVSIGPEVEFEQKFQKLCHYYSTKKGCRNGSSCRFLHEPPEQKQRKLGGRPEVPKTKRMKADGFHTGW